jgi:hypothetical protein
MLQSGDLFVVCRFHRVRRSPKHGIELMDEPDAAAGGSDSGGPEYPSIRRLRVARWCSTSCGAVAESDRNLVGEWTFAGQSGARERGRKGGGRKKLGDRQRAVAVDPFRQKKHTIDEI